MSLQHERLVARTSRKRAISAIVAAFCAHKTLHKRPITRVVQLAQNSHFLEWPGCLTFENVKRSGALRYAKVGAGRGLKWVRTSDELMSYSAATEGALCEGAARRG